MKSAALLVLSISTLVAFAVSPQPPESKEKTEKAKEVTLKGTILCAKCALMETKKCVTMIQVKKDGKTTSYYFDDKGMKEEYHEGVCGGEKKEGTVKGTVVEKSGKKWIKPTKVDFAKT